MLNILYLLPLFLLVLLVDAGDNQRNSLRKLQPRIWGGINAPNRRYFPYHVALYVQNNGTHKVCGGTLISKSFVLTAAHCVANIGSDNNWETTRRAELIFGMSKYYSVENDTDSYFMIVNKTGIIIHPSYNSSTEYNDIALIKLPREATLTPYIQLASLPFKNETRGFIVGQQLFSTGWGRLGDYKKEKPTKLQYMITQIVPENECIHRTNNQFDNGVNICINAANRSICRGDSGGPNVVFTNKRAILIGISSHGMIPSSKNLYIMPCEAGLPQILTRVSYYLPWIHNHTRIPIY